MRAIDFWILMLCCLGWGGNFVVSAWALGQSTVPPFMLATTRAGIVLLLAGVFLFRPLPKRFGRLLTVSVCVGALHLAFLYTGLQTAPASGGSIVSQALIPLAAVLSVIFLKERLPLAQAVAIAGAFAGVLIMVWDPADMGFDIGLIYILLAYLMLAIGSIIMRTVPEIDWKVYVAWTAVVVLLCSAVLSFVLETGQFEVVKTDWAPLLITAAYAAVAVSVFAHGQYFRLLQRYPVNRVVPLTLMMTVFATALGVLILDETLYPRYLVGAAIILPCVWFVARGGGIDPSEGET